MVTCAQSAKRLHAFNKKIWSNSCVILTILAALLLTPAAAFAQYYSGGSNWDFSIGAIYQTGKSAGGSNDSSLRTSDEVGLGLTLGYKLNRWFTIGGDLDYLSPRYSAVLVSENDPTDTINIDHRATQFNGRIKGTFNFTEGPFIPYAQLGIGWSSFDSNVADGPPQTGCWWHPWWGYICSNYYRTYGSTEFSYGVSCRRSLRICRRNIFESELRLLGAGYRRLPGEPRTRECSPALRLEILGRNYRQENRTPRLARGVLVSASRLASRL